MAEKMRGPSQRGARFGAIGQIGLRPPLHSPTADIKSLCTKAYNTRWDADAIGWLKLGCWGYDTYFVQPP